jgi:hypothetical protein
MIRIFNKENLIVIIDTDTWRVTKRAEGDIWYKYNSLDAPILYSIYQKQPEQDLVLDKDYTKFAKENGDAFLDDLTFQSYIDEVFSPNLTLEESDGKESFALRNGDTLLKTVSVKQEDILKEMLTELRKMNFHLSVITENNLNEIDT